MLLKPELNSFVLKPKKANLASLYFFTHKFIKLLKNCKDSTTIIYLSKY